MISQVSRFFMLLVFVLCICACRDNTNSTQTESTPSAPNKDLSGQGVSELYKYYVDNPAHQAHIDENLIIDYIVEQEAEYQRLPSGLYYKIIKAGEGDNYKWGGPCKAHYEGYFLNGQVFDSSYSRNSPLNFNIGQMNASWNEILQHVNPGTELKIIAPSRLAYGERGFPGYVPPNTVIAFSIVTLAQ